MFSCAGWTLVSVRGVGLCVPEGWVSLVCVVLCRARGFVNSQYRARSARRSYSHGAALRKQGLSGVPLFLAPPATFDGFSSLFQGKMRGFNGFSEGGLFLKAEKLIWRATFLNPYPPPGISLQDDRIFAK